MSRLMHNKPNGQKDKELCVLTTKEAKASHIKTIFSLTKSLCFLRFLKATKEKG